MAELISTMRESLLTCIHCKQEIPASRSQSSFCCLGCEIVYGLLKESGLEKFHELKPTKLLPLIGYFSREHNFEWADQLQNNTSGKVTLAIEGIQCAACVWLIKQLGQKRQIKTFVNNALGTLEIHFIPDTFSLKNFLKELSRFGYRTQELKKQNAEKNDHGLLLRLGICMAIAMNTMFLSISVYLGLSTNENLFSIFDQLNFYLSFVSVMVGGSYFFHRAFQALKNKILHFDLPVALGILATFSGSTYSYWHRSQEGTYFDTLNIFIALMLLGRYLQNKFIQTNRNSLLQEKDLAHFSITRLQSTQLETTSFSSIQKNDQLLLQSGSVVPVPCHIENHPQAEFSLSWISGESKPVLINQEEIIPAGAILISHFPVIAIAQESFDQSRLHLLSPQEKDHELLPVTWAWVTRWYVSLVLLAAFSTLGYWLLHDPARAPFVFTSILVVTCPCSLGIAIPLARHMANKTLLSSGVFARDGALLDRIKKVKKIIFDKTGTLTLTEMTLKNREDLDFLSIEDQQILYSATSQSRHPASLTISHVLQAKKTPWLFVTIEEIPGKGISLAYQENHYFIGKQEESSVDGYEVSFIKNGSILVRLILEENRLLETVETTSTLQKMGYALYLLSGDKDQRVTSMAQDLHIDPKNVRAECQPEDKASFVRKINDQDTLMLGDGLNDAPAFKEAFLCGAPLGEKNIMASQADFFFISGSLSWIPTLIQTAQKLRSTINFNLSFAACYNILTITAGALGFLSPLACVVLMPSGSLLVLSITTTRMRRKR